MLQKTNNLIAPSMKLILAAREQIKLESLIWKVRKDVFDYVEQGFRLNKTILGRHIYELAACLGIVLIDRGGREMKDLLNDFINPNIFLNIGEVIEKGRENLESE